MPGVFLWGWTGTKWIPVLVNAAGKLIIDPSEILEDTPTDGEVGKAPTSNWAHDHADLPDVHHDAFVAADHTAIGNAAPHHAEAHTLASHTTKAHAELTGVGTSDHHVRYSDAEAVAAAIAGGLDKVVSKIIVSTRDMTGGDGSVSYTGVGFKPSCIIALAAIVGANVSIGFSASNLGNTRVNSLGALWYVGQQLIVVFVNVDNFQLATLASYDADGFTLAWGKTGAPTGTATLYFLCLK